MTNEPLSFELTLPASHGDAVERVTAALKQEGFGVLTRIDIHDAFKEKLGIDHPPYTILGACNPPLAHRALTADARVGLLLPCNVTVEAVDGTDTVVRFVNPVQMLQVGALNDNPEIASVAGEAYDRLRRVVTSLAA